MRDNIRKPAPGHLSAALAAALALWAAHASAQTAGEGRAAACAVFKATLGERGLSTAELSTEQMEVALVREDMVLVVDARPYEEYAMGHITDAKCGSEVGEIEKLTGGRKGQTIVVYCNGLFCGQSKRLAQDLLAAGYTHVSRYELGIPVWRALGHPVVIEADAIWPTLERDKTAVVIDARDPSAFRAGTLPGAKNVRFEDAAKAKDDGRLPMLDHNTRIIVVGKDASQALAVAQEIARNAFQNVAYVAGPVLGLMRSRPLPETR